MSNLDVLVVGNYNSGNFGDDLLLQSCRENLADLELKVLACSNSDFLTFPAGFRSICELRRFIDPLRAIYFSRVVLFGGGGLFNSDVIHSLFIWMPILFLSILLRKPIFIFGHSFSSKPNFLLAWMLRQVKVLTVRDVRSLEFCRQARVKSQLTMDLALELKSKVLKKVEEKKYVLLSYRTYGEIDLEMLKKVNDILLPKITALSLQPLYVAFDKLDESVYDSLGFKFIPAKDLEKYLPLIKFSALMRLHANIYCFKHGITGLVLSYASKVKGLFQSFDYSGIIDLQSKSCLDDLYSLDFTTLEQCDFEGGKKSMNPWDLIKEEV